MTCTAQSEPDSEADKLTKALYASLSTAVPIPPPLDKMGADDAYIVQERVFTKRGAQLAGWKLAATSEAGQKEMALESPIIGRLSASDILASGHQVESARGKLYAEAELAVTLDSDLPARTEPYGISEVASAIGQVRAAIELCTSRYDNDEVSAAALIADNAFAYRLVLGRTLAEGWSSRFASMPVILCCGPGQSIVGSTAAVMQDPINAVTWLANWMSDRGQGLKRGQVIATGSCTGVNEVHPGETVRASFANAEGATATIIPRNAVRRFE